MSLLLFYDTETTGLPMFDQPSEHPEQPHIVQLAAALIDSETRKRVAGFDLVIAPDGWTIPGEVAAIHGITTEMAKLVGVSERAAVELLLYLWARAQRRIAHNESFDARIVRIALMRYLRPEDVLHEQWKAAPSDCTQRLATPICRMPPTAKMRAVGRHHFKSANLGEAFKHFTGREMLDAHNATADVTACIEVYFAIKHPVQSI